MQEVVGSNPTEGKICFSQFTPFYEVECEKLFCKTNLKLKLLKLKIKCHKTQFVFFWEQYEYLRIICQLMSITVYTVFYTYFKNCQSLRK